MFNQPKISKNMHKNTYTEYIMYLKILHMYIEFKINIT